MISDLLPLRCSISDFLLKSIAYNIRSVNRPSITFNNNNNSNVNTSDALPSKTLIRVQRNPPNCCSDCLFSDYLKCVCICHHIGDWHYSTRSQYVTMHKKPFHEYFRSFYFTFKVKRFRSYVCGFCCVIECLFIMVSPIRFQVTDKIVCFFLFWVFGWVFHISADSD